MIRPDSEVDDDLTGRPRGLFRDDEIVGLTGLASFQNMSSKFNSALGVPPQGFCQVPGTPRQADPALTGKE